MIAWIFERKHGEKERNPVTDPYFDKESIARPAQALVREAIQNSLDARSNGESVRVRFFLSGKKFALSPLDASTWLGEAWNHICSSDSGIRRPPEHSEDCEFLVIEDFSTFGLEGDPEATDLPTSSDKNHFYAFFRGEGVSQNKGGRGTWGVGKTVFPRASRVNTLFALTVRQSDKNQLLMGQTILRYHTIDGVKYRPDGLFGIPKGDGFVSPISDPEVIKQFSKAFCLQRCFEPGLSVVVPFIDSEFSAEAIIDAVCREYFYQILAGKLIVEVSGMQGGSRVELTLNAGSLLSHVPPQDFKQNNSLWSLIQFAADVITIPPSELIRLESNASDDAPKWSETTLPSSQFPGLASKFMKGETVAIRVPLNVRYADEEFEPSYFDVFIKQDLKGNGFPPAFIRNGIMIPVKERRMRGYKVFAIVVIEDPPLAKMLADAETPAHDEWSHTTEHFKGEYLDGRQCLDYVIHAPRQITEILTTRKSEKDRFTLADFFPRAPEDPEVLEIDSEDDASDDPDVSPPKPNLIVKTKPRAFIIQKLRGGFRIARGDSTTPLPRLLEVSVAYDRQRGNPLKKYHSADFSLDQLPVALTGIGEMQYRGNKMTVEVCAENFDFQVEGFDKNRDLYVRALEVGAPND